jgi:hypothetical protein
MAVVWVWGGWVCGCVGVWVRGLGVCVWWVWGGGRVWVGCGCGAATNHLQRSAKL